MLPFLEDLKEQEYDCISFLPDLNEEGDLRIEAGQYIEKSEEVKGAMGNKYHINLFKQNKDLSVEYDSFEAILADPLVYMSHIIPSGFFGFITKKTTDSDEFNEEMLSKLKEIYV